MFGRPQALSADRPRRRPGRGRPDRRRSNCIPGTARPGKPEVPGRLVFDLDPAPDVAFDDGRSRRREEMRERLEELGLVSFCKTTGGKGLHVVTPLARPNADSTGRRPRPSRATSACRWPPTAGPLSGQHVQEPSGTGKIFLDYLRNDRMATAVAPLSPRARAGATVSMPLTWAQVKASSTPSATPCARAGAAAKSKAWKDYCDALRPLEPAIKKLGKVKQAA